MTFSSAVELTPIDLGRSVGVSVDETLVEPTDVHGNKVRWEPGARVFLHVVNNSVSDVTITLTSSQTIDGLALATHEYVVKATGDVDGLDDQLIGGSWTENWTYQGYVWVTFSAVADILVGAFRV